MMGFLDAAILVLLFPVGDPGKYGWHREERVLVPGDDWRTRTNSWSLGTDGLGRSGTACDGPL